MRDNSVTLPLIVIAILISILITFYFWAENPESEYFQPVSNKNELTQEANDTEESTYTFPDFSGSKMVVRASDLASEYDNNSVRTDAKYAGRPIEITGSISNIASTDDGGASLNLNNYSTNPTHLAVYASGGSQFKSDVANIVKLSAEITLLCHLDSIYLDRLVLIDCLFDREKTQAIAEAKEGERLRRIEARDKEDADNAEQSRLSQIARESERKAQGIEAQRIEDESRRINREENKRHSEESERINREHTEKWRKIDEDNQRNLGNNVASDSYNIVNEPDK